MIMKFLKSNKMKAVALTLVVALMGGAVYNAGGFSSKANKAQSEAATQLADMDAAQLSELSEDEVNEIVKDMDKEALEEAAKDVVTKLAVAAAKEYAPELELNAEVSSVVYDKLTNNVIGYEVAYSADEVEYGYAVIDTTLENGIADMVIEANVPSLYKQLTQAYSAVTGTDKEEACGDAIYTTFTGKYAVSSVNNEAEEFFFDSAVYSEDEFKAIVENNAQNSDEKFLSQTMHTLLGLITIGTLVYILNRPPFTVD